MLEVSGGAGKCESKSRLQMYVAAAAALAAKTKNGVFECKNLNAMSIQQCYVLKKTAVMQSKEIRQRRITGGERNKKVNHCNSKGLLTTIVPLHAFFVIGEKLSDTS